MSDPANNEAGALRLALTAMKERCQKLQSRLAALEEETLQLRIERHSIPALSRREEPPTETSLLYKRVEELTRCNSRLAHHAFMVAKENKQLWERLAQLAPAEPQHLTRTQQLKPHKSLQIFQICGGGGESMEEVPLRLCNGSKTNEEMEWEEGSLTRVEECGFPISDVEDGDSVLSAESELIQTELQEVLLRLRKEKDKLIEQQDCLKSAVNVLARLAQNNPEEADSLVEYGDPPQSLRSDRSSCEEKFRSEGEVLKVANTLSTKDASVTGSNPPQMTASSSTLNAFAGAGNNFEDRICPLCSKFYSKTTPFDEFNDHVLSHFVEQTDGDSDSHLSSYEIAA